MCKKLARKIIVFLGRNLQVSCTIKNLACKISFSCKFLARSCWLRTRNLYFILGSFLPCKKHSSIYPCPACMNLARNMHVTSLNLLMHIYIYIHAGYVCKYIIYELYIYYTYIACIHLAIILYLYHLHTSYKYDAHWRKPCMFLAVFMCYNIHTYKNTHKL